VRNIENRQLLLVHINHLSLVVLCTLNKPTRATKEPQTSRDRNA
jgi:hypothetical protein